MPNGNIGTNSSKTPSVGNRSGHGQIRRHLDELGTLLETAKTEADAFESGNKAASTRLRKAMQSMKTEAQTVRGLTTEIRNAM